MVSQDVVFDESRVVGGGEKLEISAGNGLAETPLNQSLPKEPLLSQQNKASTHVHENEDLEESDSPNNHEQNLSPVTPWNNDGLEESITVRGQIHSLPIGARRTTPSQNSPPATNTTSLSTSERTAAEREQALSHRPQQTRKQPEHFQPAAWQAMVAHANDEPQTLGDAPLASTESTEWMRAWESELKSPQDNGTWVVEDLPKGTRAIGCHWGFKLKEEGRYKAHLVAKGYSQKACIDYHETFAPVAKFTTLRSLLALAAENDWDIDGMDVKSAFLHGDLEEVIYMEIPEGLEVSQRAQGGSEHSPIRACRLIKTIYGLKQAPRAWYGKINSFFSESGFVRSMEDHSLYVHESRRLIILLYVDDLVLAAFLSDDITWIKELLSKQFEMTDLGQLTSFIGIQVVRERAQRTLKISQGSYISRVLTDHGMGWCAAVATPVEGGTKLQKLVEGFIADPENRLRYQSAVGSLLYAMLGSRPDIAYAMGLVSQSSYDQEWGVFKFFRE